MKELDIKRVTTTVTNTAAKGAKGGKNGQNYIQMYLRALQKNPLRTKMLTSGTLSALQELLASVIARDKPKHGTYLTPRVPKMALYGALVSAPLGHLLITILQKLFEGRTSVKSKILQIIVSNIFVSPLQNTVMLASLAIVNGAQTFHQIKHDVKKGFLQTMTVSWITSPIALIIAQKFLPPHAWVPFFNMLGFVIGTYINATQKKRKIAAIKKKKSEKYWESSKKESEKPEYSSYAPRRD